MKRSADAILRTEQADYLDALHVESARALATMAESPRGRPRSAARADGGAGGERGYPISDPEVGLLPRHRDARLARAHAVVELGTNIGYGADRAGARGRGGRAGRHHRVQLELVGEARGFIAEAGLSQRIEVRHGMAIAELEKITRGPSTSSTSIA